MSKAFERFCRMGLPLARPAATPLPLGWGPIRFDF